MGKKRDTKVKSADKENTNKIVKKEEPVQKIEEIEEDSITSEEDIEDVEVDSKENKKSRIATIEKNIEVLETMNINTGVIYLGHLPWGFDEIGIKKYFQQFGKITRILVPKSKNVKKIINI